MHFKIMNLLLIWPFLSAQLKADDASLPLGKRQYLLESKIPHAPVAIEALGGARPDTMRDPIPLGSAVLLPKGEAGRAPQMRQKKVSRMVFDQVAVKGRYLVPRVSFDRPSLELERSEEATEVDYRGKIKQSEDILRDFDW